MTVLFLGASVALLWLFKQVIGVLIGQQVKGSIPDYTARMAKNAARLLPEEVAAEYEHDWLAELAVLGGKPITAIRYARGLRSAARSISAAVGGEVAASRWWPALMRAIDLNGSIIMLVLLLPLLGIITTVLTLSGKPVLVRRTRLGKGGKAFGLVSFRTGPLGSDGRRDARGVGVFLERSALAELPSLFNILRGDISIVGPPPQRLGSELPMPLQVRPGLSSWQRLVEIGATDVSLEEALRRDRQRTFRSDMVLFVQQWRLLFSGLR